MDPFFVLEFASRFSDKWLIMITSDDIIVRGRRIGDALAPSKALVVKQDKEDGFQVEVADVHQVQILFDKAKKMLAKKKRSSHN